MKEHTKKRVFSDFLLIFMAMIWGTAFVFQREGTDFINPFLFNGYRYFLGAIVLAPLLLLRKTKLRKDGLLTGATLGVILFFGSGLQQAGLAYTSASKGGFITSLYVIFVPILGLLIYREKPTLFTWIISGISVTGLYLVSISGAITINFGDVLIFLCSIFWGGHVLFVDKKCGKFDSILIAFAQFATASVLSFLTTVIFYQEISIPMTWNVLEPLLYTGVLSTAVAFSIQIIAQKNAPSTDAAVIMSSEALFAAIAGFLLLGEILTTPQYIGCGLIFLSIILVQIPLPRKMRKRKAIPVESELL